jgi:ribonuclease HI
MTKSHPIRSLLRRPVLSGRLAQWLLQLSQYEIITKTPTAIKSQAIADLLAQFPGEDSSSISHEVPGGVGEALLADLVNSIWTLKFDSSSTSSSSGAGIVLIKEEGEIIAKSFKRDFSCSNNVSEYEAHIIGLAITHEMGIKHLRVIGDSNLVICQTKGEFSLKEPSLAPYHALAQKLEEKFDTFEVSHAMRCGNRYADALATLGSQISFEGPKVNVTINKRNTPITDLLKEEFEEQCLDAEDWRTPIKAKLMSLKGVADLKMLKDYVLIAGDLYRKLLGGVLAICVSLRKAAKKLTEVHERSCEFRDKVSLYRRLQCLSYFWPNMSKEVANLQECRHSFCQLHFNYNVHGALLTKNPKNGP